LSEIKQFHIPYSWLRYWRFRTFFNGANYFRTLLLRRGRSNCTKFERNRVLSSQHQTRNFGTDRLIRFEMMAAQRRVVSKIEAKFHTFWPP